ncbi:Inosine-uridine preferring nucleoside hydrolase [Posidoniimonas polymericola]|uniref:Inosine-uridine preferring nucleoside hydrolase n=1 Tax=Posidoniimonas polymericola TaxID=2528002 RepID=A0A5C5ZFE2_9BACT|nr:Inosine-uridine preferring nucleoside hydrolase [Posidoniimonas polymericola]
MPSAANRRLFAVLSIALAATVWRAAGACQAAEPTPLIFDTDFGNDCDDVLALAMVHTLADRGECDLLAVTVTKDHPYSAPFVDVVNTFYGRGDTPIGVCRSGVTPDEGKYNGLCQATDDGQFRYPHDLTSGADAPDAVAVLRESLAAAADRSVVICQVGFSTNLAALLASAADEHSPLAGRELIAQKVRLLSVMAGAFESIPGPDGQPRIHREYNVERDLASAQTLAEQWPTPTVWSGFEIGIALPYPHESIEQDFGYFPHHPVAEAYRLYSPPPHNRPTWDLTTVLYAVRPDEGYFRLSPPGRVTIDDNAVTHFQAEGHRDRYLIIGPAARERALVAMVELTSARPATDRP